MHVTIFSCIFVLCQAHAWLLLLLCRVFLCFEHSPVRSVGWDHRPSFPVQFGLCHHCRCYRLACYFLPSWFMPLLWLTEMKLTLMSLLSVSMNNEIEVLPPKVLYIDTRHYLHFQTQKTWRQNKSRYKVCVQAKDIQCVERHLMQEAGSSF